MTPDEIREQIKAFRDKGDAITKHVEDCHSKIQTIKRQAKKAEHIAITYWAKAEALEAVLRMKETEQ